MVVLHLSGKSAQGNSFGLYLDVAALIEDLTAQELISAVPESLPARVRKSALQDSKGKPTTIERMDKGQV